MQPKIWGVKRHQLSTTTTQPPPTSLPGVAPTHGERLSFGSVVNIGALISIEAFTAGSATARLYSMRMIDMPKIFSDIKSRVDILRATTQANALNQQINSINPDKAFKQEELHERLVHVLATPPLNLVDVHRRAHTETDLKKSAKQENRRRGGRASQATTHAPHSFHCAHYTTGPLPL